MYVVDPQVSVVVQEYRSQRVFVLGEAEKPGTYALTGQAALLDILSQAGGPSKAAGRQVIIVRFPGAEEPVAPGAAGSRRCARTSRRCSTGMPRRTWPSRAGTRSTAEDDQLLRARRGPEARRLRAGEGHHGAGGHHARGGFTERAAPPVAKSPPQAAGRLSGERDRPGGAAPGRGIAPVRGRHGARSRPGTASTFWAKSGSPAPTSSSRRPPPSRASPWRGGSPRRPRRTGPRSSGPTRMAVRRRSSST